MQSPSSTAEQSTLWSGLNNQKRVLGAMLMREILTRYGRHNIGFMWMFCEPMLFTIGVTILWNIMGHHSLAGISITAFVLTGYSTLLLWRNMPTRCIAALGPNYSLMYHRQVKPLDVYISRLILEVSGATMSLIILSTVFIVAGLVELPKDYLMAFFGWFLLAWYAFALSLFIGALSEQIEIIERIWHIFQYLMIPLSGSFFIVESLPTPFQSIVLLNPTVNCAEMFREGFFGTSYVWHYDIGYVVIFNMALTLLGLSQVRYVSKNLVIGSNS